MRRVTRLTNALSKKVENLAHAVALHFMHFIFVRVHKTLGTTPAVVAGVAGHEWTVAEIVKLLEPRLPTTLGFKTRRARGLPYAGTPAGGHRQR